MLDTISNAFRNQKNIFKNKKKYNRNLCCGEESQKLTSSREYYFNVKFQGQRVVLKLFDFGMEIYNESNREILHEFFLRDVKTFGSEGNNWIVNVREINSQGDISFRCYRFSGINPEKLNEITKNFLNKLNEEGLVEKDVIQMNKSIYSPSL